MSHPPPRQDAGALSSYDAFWPYYLREHAQVRTRNIHFFGTGAALFALLAAVVSGNILLVPMALVLGYGPAWYAHFFVEKNRPATFRFPLWSLYSDLRMAWLWASGRLSAELKKAGVPVSTEERG